MMFLSGVFFPVDQFPMWVQILGQILPLSHVVALVRPLFFDQWPSNPGLHLGVLLLTASAAWGLALHLTRRRFRQ